jgi:2-phospho-L-lactate/phosphoenolpyruvate guanylyltransferase
MRRSTDSPPNVWAIVPVKKLSRGKQRLSPVLSGKERAELVRAMLHDVLTTLCATPELAGIIVVTGDPRIANLATLFEARVVTDVMETGVNAAVQQGLAILDAQSARVLIIPADLPFATASDLLTVIAELNQYPVVLAPALCDGGTNALAMRQPDLIAPSFGDDSFARHQALACESGIDCGIVRTDGLGRDIDCPDDLVSWSGSKKFSQTALLLAEFNVAKRLGIAASPASEAHVK